MAWIDDKRRRDEEEAQHQRAAQEAEREQRTQEQQLKAEERAHRAAQESLRPASEQKIKTAPLVVNLNTQTNQSAVRIASRIPDETERDGFLTEYIAHVKKQSSPNYQKYAPTIGTMRELTDAVVTGGVYADTRKKYDKQVQSRNEAMQTLAGARLMGFDGKTIDVNTADPQTVMRGINMIADDEERASAAKAYKTLAGLEGSRFYGSSTDGLGTFLESGNMKADKYRSTVKGYRASFYGDGKHDEQDEAAYWAKTAEIAGRNYTDYAKAQYQAALDKAYRDITGKEIPTRQEAQSLPDAGQGDKTPAEDGAQTQKKGLLEAAADAVAGFFGGEPQAAEEAGKEQEKGADAPEAPLPGTPPAPAATPEPTPNPTEPEPTATPEPMPTPTLMPTAAAETPEPTMEAEPEEGDRTEQGEANEPARQAETASDKPEEGAGEAAGPIQQKKRDAEEEIIARGGMSFAEWAEEHPQEDESAGGHAEEEKKQAGTLSAALGAMMRGELGEYEGEGVEELNRLYEGHELVRRVIGTFGEEDSKQIRLGNEGAEYAAARAMANMGTSFRTLEGALESSTYPKEVKTDILAQAVRWAARAEEMELAGTLPDGGETLEGTEGDARYGTPLLERYLTQTDEGKREYQATLDALRALDDQKAQMRRQQEEDDRKALEEARQAVRSGYYSDEQLALVTESAKDVGYEQLMENGSWGELKERRSEIDGYLAGDGFERSAVYSRMAADGVRDADAEFAYKTLLGDQMNVILQEEATTAYTLGMTLEEYLSAQGGMSMEQLGTLASARIEKMGASLTEEDEAALDKLEKPTYGEGVGVAAVVAGGIKTGAEQYYYDFKNSLYEGLTLSEVERTGTRMQEQYQREYGLYGRDKYVSDLTEAALSGVWDESFSNAVMKALATSADPYTIGIDPGDVEERLLLRGNRAIKADLAETERYIAQNGTEGENLWFGRVKSMTYNTVSAGVSTGAGMAAGSGALGFIAGYSVVGYKNNLDEALEEGFSLKTGKTMAALNTAKDYAVNVGVFNKIFGQITGAGAPIEAAQDIITRNPTGAAKFLGRLAAFSEAALENELDEVFHDEAYETIGSNVIDATFGELLRKADAGENIGMSDWLDMMMAAANPSSYDLYGTAKHVKETAVENAIGSILFSVAGGYGAAMHAYPSAQKAADVVSGKSEDIAGTLKAIREDLKDAEFRKAMDEDAAQQQLDRETARQLIYGADRNGTMAAAREAQAQADGYDRQAQSSRQAMDEAAQTLEAAQTALESGTAEPMTAQELADAAMDYAKAKQRSGEAESRQEQKRQEAEELLGLRTREARKAAQAAIKAQAESAKAVLLEDGQIENRRISEQIGQTQAQIDRAEAEFNDAMDRFEEAGDTGLDYDGMFEAFEEQADRYAEKLEALETQAAARSGAARQEKTEEGAPQAEQTAKKPPEQAAENGGEDAQAVDMGDSGQYSLGEVGADAGQEGADIGGLKNPIFQKFQSVIKKRHGTDVVVADLGKGVRNYYDGKLNRLFISSKIGTGEAMRVTLCHELTHSIEGSRGYEAYKEAALQAAYGGDEARMAHDKERIREVYEPIYERDVRTFTDADAENELVARATETVIERLADWTKTGGETQIYDLLGEKQRFGIRLYNRLTQFIARQRAKREGTLEAYDDLIRARDALKDALREARENENRNVDGKQYAIQWRDGKPIVVVEEDILRGVSEKEWARTVKQALKEKFPNGVTVGNNQIQITGKSRNEITHSKDTMWLKRNQSEAYADKMRAANQADELLKASADYVDESPAHERKDSIVDFGRGTVRIEVNGRPYDAEVIVGTKKDGSMLLYDFIGMTKKEMQRTAGRQSAPHDSLPHLFLTPSIAQSDAGVNIHDTQNGKKYALDLKAPIETEQSSHYDYSKPFREQVEDWQAGKIPEQDSLIVGRTPEVFRKIGLSDVPMTFDQRHTDYAVNAAKADHQMSMEMIERLPELLENPIAIIGSETRADDSLVAIIEATINGKPVVAPVTIQTTSESNGVQIDANHLASAYGKKNAVRLLENAIQKENADGVGVYYLDKSRASNLVSDPRVQFPSISEKTGLIHSIFDAGSPVKRKYLEQTETRQFKRWFEGSRIVNEDGNPKIMYHGTREENGDFHVFDYSKAVKKGGLGMKALGAGNYFTATRLTGNERYGSRVIEAYLSIKKPLEVNAGETFGEAVRRETGLDTKDMGYDAIQQAMRERGYDGVVQHDKAGNITIAVAFDSEQIKSATDNIGLFDKENPDIRYALDLNQFGGESAARTDSLVDAIRRELLGNRAEKKIDREMVSQADQRYDEIGGDEVAARLRAKEYWTDEDITQAQVAMVRALEEKHDVEAAVLGKLYTLRMGQMGMHEQIENALRPLSSIYALSEAVERANRINLRRGLAVHIPAGDEAPMSNPTKAGQRIINGDANFRPVTDGDNIAILNGGGKGEVTSLYERAERFKRAAELAKPTYGTDNPWHIPMPEWKMELIDRYRLRGEKLPGYDYFKASTKERMLAAIIATDDNRRGDGLLTLCQQLEFMKKGYAVVTEADMNYITGEMATYQLLEGENPTPQTPEGRTIIQRIYSAQANTTPNNLWNKFNNFGYDNMLSSSKTWNKNIMSNVLTRPLEMGSELIGAGIDRLTAKKTGNRTTGLPQMEAIGEGHRAFAQEIANTLTDYIIRGVDTGHSSSFDFNHNNRTYNSAFMQAYHDFIGLAMQLGDRPFWEQCYTEEMDVLNRLGTMIQDTYEDENGDLQTYLREMTDEERHAEAERRATERVFQEDNRLIDAINTIRRTSKAADFCITTLIPFLKTPTNVAIRAMQYSPIGLAWTALKNGVYDAMTENGTKFDQRRFVMNMGRGLTGTGMMVIGMALAGMGVIKFGREDEDDARLAAIQKSEGKSYGMYFDILGEQIPLDFAFPAVSPLVIGAELYSAMDSYDRDEDGAALAANASRAIYTATLDQLFNNSMLSGLSNLLSGYQSNEQKVTTFVESMMENTASRLTPAVIRAVAKYTDPYVRDTKSQNALREMINANIIQNWPLLRQTLPTAKTLKGENMLQNGANNWGKAEQNAVLHFLNTFITPWTTGSEIRDAQLDELADIAYRTGETSWLPGELITGNKYKVTIPKTMAEEMDAGGGQGFTIQLTDEEKRWANETYKDVLWNGSLYTESDIRSEMESLGWAYMPDEERIEAVKACQKEAKRVVLEELVRRKKQP